MRIRIDAASRKKAAYNSVEDDPRMSKLMIDERHAGDVTILVLTGQILLDDGDLAFKRQVDSLVGNGRIKILVDMALSRHNEPVTIDAPVVAGTPVP